MAEMVKTPERCHPLSRGIKAAPLGALARADFPFHVDRRHHFLHWHLDAGGGCGLDDDDAHLVALMVGFGAGGHSSAGLPCDLACRRFG